MLIIVKLIIFWAYFFLKSSIGLNSIQFLKKFITTVIYLYLLVDEREIE